MFSSSAIFAVILSDSLSSIFISASKVSTSAWSVLICFLISSSFQDFVDLSLAIVAFRASSLAIVPERISLRLSPEFVSTGVSTERSTASTFWETSSETDSCSPRSNENSSETVVSSVDVSSAEFSFTVASSAQVSKLKSNPTSSATSVSSSVAGASFTTSSFISSITDISEVSLSSDVKSIIGASAEVSFSSALSSNEISFLSLSSVDAEVSSSVIISKSSSCCVAVAIKNIL